jgi:hypothetical protein
LSNSDVLKKTTVAADVSERDAIFGTKRDRNERVPSDPRRDAGMPMGTAYLFDKLLIPGGPGRSDRYSGPVVLDPEHGYPLGLWYYPSNPDQHKNIDRYWIPATGNIVIQVKKSS